MLKVRFQYDLPDYDPAKHDPDRTFAFLTYRGVHYAKWVDLKSRGNKNWKISSWEGLSPLFFCATIYLNEQVLWNPIGNASS